MTDLNHLKKMKGPDPSEKLLKKHISPKPALCWKREFNLKLNPEALLLQRIKRTKAFTWRFDPQDELKTPKEASKMLSQALGLDKTIHKLLGAPPANFREDDFLHFIPSLKRLKSLQEISLGIGDSEEISDSKMNFLMKNFANLCLLKNISLEFVSEDITDIRLHYISRALKRIPSLKKFQIDLVLIPDISHKGLSKLNASLNHLTKLEDICLRIAICKMTDLGVEKMNFKRLVSLQRIVLFFPGTRLTDKGVSLITRSLKGLFNLHTVKLEFLNCEEISDFGLLCIWKMMNSLPSLRAVTLVFSQCSNITDAGFLMMMIILKDLPLIRKAHFEFYCCTRITNVGIFALCQVLKEKFPGLQRLSLPFGGCSQITDTGVKEIIDCMNRLPDLRNIVISLSESEKITDVSLDYISQFLKSRVSLEKIKIYYIKMSGATDEGKAEFEKEIDNLKRQRLGIQIESHSKYSE